jgi:hypothetical protein
MVVITVVVITVVVKTVVFIAAHTAAWFVCNRGSRVVNVPVVNIPVVVVILVVVVHNQRRAAYDNAAATACACTGVARGPHAHDPPVGPNGQTQARA